MTPRDQNLLSALNILVLVFRAQKNKVPKLDLEQQHTFQITKEHIAQAGLTIPVFINTLQDLAKKGYLIDATSVFEEKYHPKLQEALSDEKYDEIQEAFRKLDIPEFQEKLKTVAADLIEKTAPAYIPVDRAEIMKEDITIPALFDKFRDVYKDHSPEMVSMIMLSPFRSIERLLEKLNAGIAFDDVKDEGIWYDPIAYEFHFDDKCVSTAYQGKPTLAHFALATLFAQFEESRIDYADIPGFDIDNKTKEKKRYFDALKGFIEKHSRLPEIFSVHTDHLEIHESYLEHPH